MDTDKNTLPKRKSTRLKNFDYSSNGAYFVTICTQNKEKILCNIVGGDAHIAPSVELKSYGKTVDRYINNISSKYPHITVDKYVIMPNHIHLMIRIDGMMWASSPTTISDIVRSIKILTTKETGKSIFQRSFHDHIIRNEADYLKIWNYIDTNPAKWTDDCFYIE